MNASRPRVAAHRGTSARFPENTLAAFDAAIAAGAEAIELDVHATSDGQLVVVHDYDLARTTNGNGLVHDSTSDYVRSLDAGGWFAPEHTGERVPLAAEILSLDVAAFELEVKGLPSEALVASVCRVVEASGRVGTVQITGHHHQMVSEVKRRLPGAVAGFFVSRKEPWMTDHLYRQLVERSALFGGFDVVHARLDDLRALDVDRLHELGFLVHAGDVNGTGALLEAADLGADHLTTNDAAVALELFGRDVPVRGGDSRRQTLA